MSVLEFRRPQVHWMATWKRADARLRQEHERLRRLEALHAALADPAAPRAPASFAVPSMGRLVPFRVARRTQEP